MTDSNIQKQHKSLEYNFNEFYLCCLIFLPALSSFLFDIVRYTLNITLVSIISYAFLLLLGAVSVIKYLFKKKSVTLACIIIFAAAWFAYFTFGDIRKDLYASPYDIFKSPINILMFYCLPALLATPYITNYQNLFIKMTKWARCTIIIGIITYLLDTFSFNAQLQYMSFSYFMLTSICVCYIGFHKTGKMSSLIFAILGSVNIILCGARGAVVSLFLFLFIIPFVFASQMPSGRKIIYAIILAAVTFLVFFMFKDILNWTKAITDKIGIKSRSIDKLIDAEFFDTPERNRIRDVVHAGISHNPFGYGLFGDRHVIKKFGYEFGNVYTYAHNVFLEMLCDFGVFIGPILFTALFVKIFKTVFKHNDEYCQAILWSLIPYGIFQLFFSGSFLQNTQFFIICGIALRHRQKNN